MDTRSGEGTLDFGLCTCTMRAWLTSKADKLDRVRPPLAGQDEARYDGSEALNTDG